MVTYKATVQQKGMKGSGPVHHKNVTEHETVNVVCQEAVVATFPNDQAPAGRFQCPFEFTLPPDAPSTMLKVKDGKNTASLCYSVGVTCLRPGWLKKNLVHKVPIEVLANLPTTPPERALMDIPISNCCFSAGHVAIAATPAKAAYLEGDKQIAFSYELDNQSSDSISRVGAKLIERVWWKAQKHTHVTEVVLGEAEFDGVGRKAKLGFGNDLNPPKQVVFDLPPAFKRFSFTSLLCPTIQVVYQVELEARMSGSFVEDPFIRMDVNIARSIPVGSGPAVLPDQEEGGQAFIPFATPVQYHPNPSMRITNVPGVQHSAAGKQVASYE